jgi:exosortase
VGLADTLRTNDDYSAGQLVPLVAAFLAWRERKALRDCLLVPCWGGGMALLLLAELTRIYGFVSMRQSLERYALMVAVAGLVLLVVGKAVFRRVLWILFLLFLMVPLPQMIHSRISPPLQSVATTGSVFLLEAFGAPVTQQGNIVLLGDSTPIAIAEACSGLRMLTAFVIVAAFVACMVKRPRWQKAVLLLSSVPVAVICNIVRIFVTAVLMLYVGSEVGETFFHDFAGFVMMPVAVIILFGEISLMDRLVVPEPKSAPQRTLVARRSAPRACQGVSPGSPG